MAAEIITKQCPNCKEIKSLLEFYKNRSRRDGYNWWCKMCEKSYKQSPISREAQHRNNRKHRFNYPEQKKAGNAITSAITAGRISPAKTKRCAICGEQAKHYHHPDYSKPFEIIPLCIICHKENHEPVGSLHNSNKVFSICDSNHTQNPTGSLK